MFVDLTLGPLSEPLTGKHWDVRAVAERVQRRLGFYARKDVAIGDRVFLHHGNTPEFFFDLAAIWTLGGCAVPIDARLTAFEIETLARAALPRFSLCAGAPDQALGRALSSLSIAVLDANEADAEAPQDRMPAGSLVGLDRDALILFTSGTTGEPKGVVHTHRSLRARWAALRHSLGIAPFRRTLCLLPTHFGDVLSITNWDLRMLHSMVA